MKLISELKFLGKDKQFKQCLNKKEQKEFDWYLTFDEHAHKLIKKIIDFIKTDKFGEAYSNLPEIEKVFSKESLFLGKMRICAKNHGMKKEEKLLINAMRRSQKVLEIFRKTGSYLGKGKKEKALYEFEKILKLLG
ncbi:hypothetical protein GF374_02625 [Candidatus Woesearchaeota archaeon]|nr:hypothetical protein [Candidatus Woesearchaeota archaeon]